MGIAFESGSGETTEKTSTNAKGSANDQSKKSSAPYRDETAASLSDLYQDQNRQPSILNNSSTQLANEQLSSYLQKIQFYSLVGSVFLGLVCIALMVLGSFYSAITIFLILIGISLSAIYGAKNRDWRLIFGLFILIFIVLAYLTARGILALVLTVARAYLTDQEVRDLGYVGRSWMIISGIVEFLLCASLSIYWGINGYYTEKVMRMLLEGGPRQQRCSSPTSEVRVVGHSLYTSTDGSPQEAPTASNVDLPFVTYLSNKKNNDSTNHTNVINDSHLTTIKIQTEEQIDLELASRTHPNSTENTKDEFNNNRLTFDRLRPN